MKQILTAIVCVLCLTSKAQEIVFNTPLTALPTVYYNQVVFKVVRYGATVTDSAYVYVERRRDGITVGDGFNSYVPPRFPALMSDVTADTSTLNAWFKKAYGISITGKQ